MSWLDVARSDLPIRSELEVDGDRVSYLRWHNTGRPNAIVFVHGGGAHAHWWDHLAPKFRDHDVVALDLLGHGDSGWRETYSADVWTRQIAAVVAHAKFEARPVVIGHSLGGVIASLALHRYPELARMLVVIDSAYELTDAVDDYHPRLARHTPRIHSNDDPPEKRFVLLPAQPLSEERDLIDHIARYGTKPVPGGWQWKFDPRIFGLAKWKIAPVSVPAAIIRGELSSVMSPENAAQFAAALGNAAITTVANAHHHVTLDQPAAVVAAIQSFIA